MLNKLEQQVVKKKFSGVITLKRNAEILINKGYGFRDRANRILNHTDTAFGIASGTKVFTALGILKLVEAKKLTLTTKVFDIIDQPHPSYDKEVTLHQLLSHTSGLPDYYDEDLIEDFDNFTIETPWHMLKKPSDYFLSMPDRPMKFKPGEDFHYNNGAYVMLAMVIEKITGDYHKFLENEIFKAHHFINTGFYTLDALPENTANGYIETEKGWKTNIYNLPIIGGGDGGLFTCSQDLLMFWDKLCNYELLSKALTDKMLSPQGPEGSDEPYGYGLWLSKEKDHYNPNLIGSDAGVSFISYKDMKEDLVVNILSNSSEGVWDILDDVRGFVNKLKTEK